MAKKTPQCGPTEVTSESPPIEVVATEVCTGAASPPPTAEELLTQAVGQLVIDCEAGQCEHRQRALDQARAALKSLAQVGE